MEIRYNEKTINIKNKDTWSYNKVNNSDIKELNPQLYNQIQTKVDYQVDNQERIEKEAAQKQKAIRLAEHLVKFNEWKAKIESNFSEELKGFNVRFFPPNENSYSSYEARQLDIGSVSLRFDNQVYHANSWHSSKTDRAWVVNHDYKRTRYVKLATAIKKMIEKVNESIAEKKLKEEAEHKKNIAKDTMQDFAESNGFKFEEDWHRSNYRNGNGYYSYYMRKNNIRAEIKYSEEKKEVIIISYRVALIDDKKITIDDLERLF